MARLGVRRAPVDILAVAVVTVAAAGCDERSPTGTRYGTPVPRIACDMAGASPLVCAAEVTCSPYACAPGVGGDVTGMATWSVDHPSIVRVVGPGRFATVSDGDTVVRAETGPGVSGFKTVSVIDGSAPLPTFEIFGTVREGGAPLDGAIVEIVDGRLRGRSATSGVPPPLIPGFSGPFGGAGYFRILGVPPDTYRLRISKPGYVTQERSVTVTVGSPLVDVTLLPE